MPSAPGGRSPESQGAEGGGASRVGQGAWNEPAEGRLQGLPSEE